MSKGQSIKGTICSYKDTLVFTFSSIFSEATLQKAFFRKIAADGVEIAIETNGVYYE
jgi:pyruvate-formate lyase-activating enzyme